jgi:class 3 adenylate cyclase
VIEPDWERLHEIGLYDPEAPNAAKRRDLLVYFAECGVTEEQMVAALAGNRLTNLVGDLTLRPGRARYTREQAAAVAGTEPELIDRIWRAAGLPSVAADTPYFSDSDVEAIRAFSLGSGLFGEGAVQRFTRVVGTSLSRVAEAALAMAVANLSGPMELAGADEATLARSTADAAAALNLVPGVMEALFRSHVEVAIRRLTASRTEGALRTVNLAVAFLDLVGFTERSFDLNAEELAAAVADFETMAGEEIAAHDARLVKMIGDEVMYVATNPAAAAEIALELRDAVAGHPVLAGLRGGLVFGEVVAQDGDYYGREVNLAARVVAAAEPGQILTSAAVADALAASDVITVRTQGERALRGFENPVALFAVTRARAATPERP